MNFKLLLPHQTGNIVLIESDNLQRKFQKQIEKKT